MSDLNGKYYAVPDYVLRHLKSELNSVTDKTIEGFKRTSKILEKKEISYGQMKRIKNYFDNYEGGKQDDEYKLNGGKIMQKWVDDSLKTSRDAIYNAKKTQMDAGRENVFIKTHTKDKDNADPTRVRLAKIHKGSNARYIMNDKTVYEHIADIKYLIEYLNKS
jgi:hypothetical protein